MSSDALVARLRAAGCVFAEEEARLLAAASATASELAVMTDRRVAGVPLEHVLGWAQFYGMRVAVAEGVFVPRRRTELLVRQAAALARPHSVVVDLCCGSGAVGAAVAASVDQVELYATDIDPAAVSCARGNVAASGGSVHQGDLFGPLPASLRERVDLVVSSPPYVPTASLGLMPTEAREHESPAALDGGADGLEVVRRIVALAGDWLAPTGRVLVETSREQALHTAAAFSAAGLLQRTVHSDDLDATVVLGRRAVAREAAPRG